MPKTATAPAPKAPPKVRGGTCGARCSCGNGRCDCDAFVQSATLSAKSQFWSVCVCGHTQQVHQLIEVS